MLRLPPAGGWPVLALVAGVAVASGAAAGPAVGAAVPGLRVFAAAEAAHAGYAETARYLLENGATRVAGERLSRFATFSAVPGHGEGWGQGGGEAPRR
jgi:hypothetical protein